MGPPRRGDRLLSPICIALGERYGWVPLKGPLADQKISVTHGEYRRAREQEIPVLAFKKIIPSDKDHPDDLSARQAFWKEVMEWESGQFVSDFRLALDLSNKVATAVVKVLSDEFQKTKIKQRVDQAKPTADRAQGKSGAAELQEDPIPQELIAVVQRRDTVLFAGSGISLAAGLPSAEAFAVKLASAVGVSPHPVVGSGLASLATDVEIAGGSRLYLDSVIRPLFELGDHASSPSHLQAVKFFDRIITTNYDDLFERAVHEAKSGHEIVIASKVSPWEETRERRESILQKIMGRGARYVLKLHGTYTQPESLVITEDDIVEFNETHRAYIDAALHQLCNYAPIVVGSSLRDPTISKLFREALQRYSKRGYYLSPEILPPTRVRMQRFGLHPIRMSVESFLSTIEALRPQPE